MTARRMVIAVQFRRRVAGVPAAREDDAVRHRRAAAGRVGRAGPRAAARLPPHGHGERWRRPASLRLAGGRGAHQGRQRQRAALRQRHVHGAPARELAPRRRRHDAERARPGRRP